MPHHCQRFIDIPGSRRELLAQSATGFGTLALAGLLQHELRADIHNSLLPRETHFAPQVRSVIFLYMDGGVSQVDTFDPKPALDRINGQPFPQKIEPTQFNDIGSSLASPWKFQKYGECGTPVSDLFPQVSKHVDDLAVIRSMVSDFSEHTNGNYFLHTGHGQQGRPCMGAWWGYGLGTECQDLPHYVILNGGLIPPGGLDNFGSGFLPASYQGSVFSSNAPAVANVRRQELNQTLQQNKLELIRQLDTAALPRFSHHQQVESAIANYELAARMQLAVPDLMDISDESKEIQSQYGLFADFNNTQIFGRQCLLARRLVERGVRFIQLTCPGGNGDRWDQHTNLRVGHSKNALSVDQPIAGLLQDLKDRGLFEQTLIVWTGEFGRTPFAQGNDGRDHNPFGFSCWLAGGGVRGGTVYGATDEFGYRAVENRVEIHDLHATMLHLCGIDHERLTFRFSGRDMRLTDVHGHVVRDILA
ncbi:MAG: DUF1501 domain-containing protein [Fuerstiella sp.]|nr:DUF1501 domain-containing protein [Fuerstiella sp.]